MRILTLHRVLPTDGPGPAPTPSLVSATPETLGQHAAHLRSRYDPVSLLDVLRAVRRNERLSPRAVAVTVDDGYTDFYDHVWPLLKAYDIPVTVFVPTAYPGNPGRAFWWDRIADVVRRTERSEINVPGLGSWSLSTKSDRHRFLGRIQAHVKSLPHPDAMELTDDLCALVDPPSEPVSPVLSWDALRELAADGVTLAPHTRSHASLIRLNEDAIREEVRGSIQDLKRELGSSPPLFSYPFGAYDERVVRIVKEEGVEVAVTCVHGQNQIGSTPPLEMRRLHISLRTTPFIFRRRLSGLGARLDTWRHRRRAKAQGAS